jgi:periplasmic protein TonB
MNTSVAEKHPLGALGRIGVVAALHAGALYLIATSLGIVPPLIEKEPPPITLSPEDTPPADPLPTTPQPEPYRAQLFVDQPEVPPIDVVDEDIGLIGEVSERPPQVPRMDPPTQTVQMVGVRVDSRHPLTQPAYPMTDIRQGNEGTAEIEVYVLPSGRIGDARIVKSAGSPTLDQSALDEAKRRWRLLPAMRGGEPYAQWHRLRVTFNLKSR